MFKLNEYFRIEDSGIVQARPLQPPSNANRADQRRLVRSPDDVRELAALLRSVGPFAELPAHLLQRLCKTLRHATVEVAGAILEEGARADEVYVVLAGGVCLHEMAAESGAVG